MRGSVAPDNDTARDPQQDDNDISFMNALLPDAHRTLFLEAHHHVMVHQPLAPVAVLRTFLAGWSSVSAFGEKMPMNKGRM
jgi:hypothetical protein